MIISITPIDDLSNTFPGKFIFSRQGYLRAAPLILHAKRKRLASLSIKGMVQFLKPSN